MGNIPSKEELKAYIEKNKSAKLGKNKIADLLGVTRIRDRKTVKELLGQLEQEGFYEPPVDAQSSNTPPAKVVRSKAPAKSYKDRSVSKRPKREEKIPKMALIRITKVGEDKKIRGQFAHMDVPLPVFIDGSQIGGVWEAGMYVMAKIGDPKDGGYPAVALRVVEDPSEKIVGVITNTVEGYRFVSTQRKERDSYVVQNIKDIPPEQWDEVYEATIISRSPPIVNVGKPVCHQNEVSLISAYSFDIIMEFSPEALHNVDHVTVPPLGDRVDVRKIPLVTIDGRDSRDFDDAVWAEPDTDPKNPGGWHLMVAIADVSYYVRPGMPLDKDAFERGTSVYFPDRVIPMLPEALSNGVCSLNPKEDRAVMGVNIWIDKDGNKLRHQFFRGLMNSYARLVYEDVQRIHESPEKSDIKDLLTPLYGAYESLKKQRETRGTLEIDVAEHYVHLDENGSVKAIVQRDRLDSHRLIEEFMILANVAAAETLSAAKVPCMYRVHDLPQDEKVQELMRLLKLTGVKFTGVLVKPQDFSRLLQTVKGQPYEAIVNELVLRCQSQAIYTPENVGHFGLSLTNYAHFTSPIRRYADLLVHRGLLRTLGHTGDDVLPQVDDNTFAEWGEHISVAERRAASAERDSKDRYMTAYLEPKIGESFEVYVTGVTHSGLFVTLPNLGASGLVPMNTLGNDYFVYREHPTRLEGRRSRVVFGYGDHLTVTLQDADVLKGRMTFALKFPGENPSRPVDKSSGSGERPFKKRRRR